MLEYDFDNSVGIWIHLANHAYMRLLTERLARYDITYRQAQVLGYIAMHGPMSQTDLATYMNIEPPSLVGILDRAEEAQLIERRPCPEDRRVKHIHVLPTAKKTWKNIVKCATEVRQQAIQGISESEVRTLRRLLEKVQQNVSIEATAPS